MTTKSIFMIYAVAVVMTIVADGCLLNSGATSAAAAQTAIYGKLIANLQARLNNNNNSNNPASSTQEFTDLLKNLDTEYGKCKAIKLDATGATVTTGEDAAKTNEGKVSCYETETGAEKFPALMTKVGVLKSR